MKNTNSKIGKITLKSGCEIHRHSQFRSDQNPIFTNIEAPTKSPQEINKDEIIDFLYNEKGSIEGIAVVWHDRQGTSHIDHATNFSQLSLSQGMLMTELVKNMEK